MKYPASRPIEAMIWINEIESAKSVADLKTSYFITGDKLQTNFKVLDSKIASGLKKIINEDFKRRVIIQEEAAQKEDDFSWEGKSHGWSMSIARTATQTKPSWTSIRFLKVELKNYNVQSFNA